MMMNIFAIARMMTVISLLSASEVGAFEARELEARFRSEYPSALAELEAASSRVTCDGHLISNEDIIRDNKYYVDGESKLVISHYTDIRGQASEREAVHCKTPEYFFQLSRTTPKKPFILNSVSRGSNIGADVAFLVSLGIDRYVKSAYSIGDVSVGRLLGHSSFDITDIEEKAPQGSPTLVIIQFRCNDPSHWIGGGQMTFNPSLGWALVDYDVEIMSGRPGTKMPRGSRYKGSVRCRRWERGNIFPEEGRFEFFYPGGKGEGADVIKITNIVFGSVPQSQFKLSAFGIPDAVLKPTSGPRLDYWLLGISLFLLLLAALLRIYLSRTSIEKATA